MATMLALAGRLGKAETNSTRPDPAVLRRGRKRLLLQEPAILVLTNDPVAVCDMAKPYPKQAGPPLVG